MIPPLLIVAGLILAAFAFIALGDTVE